MEGILAGARAAEKAGKAAEAARPGADEGGN